jgi:hypothetical protein
MKANPIDGHDSWLRNQFYGACHVESFIPQDKLRAASPRSESETLRSQKPLPQSDNI